MWHQLVLVGGLSSALLFASGKIHVVEKGDTLYAISRDYHVEIAELLRANPTLSRTKPLQVGAKLRIPGEDSPVPTPPKKDAPAKPAKETPGESDNTATSTESDDNDSAPATYTVKRGDTISALSRRFKIASGELRELNGLKGNTIHAGQKLKVRRPSSPPPAPDAEPSHPVATGGNSASRPPAPKPTPAPKPRYLFIDKVKDKIDKPHVVPGRWKYVVVHHSGTPSGNAKIFDYFHKNIRGMENGLAYHFVIGNGHDSGDGEIEVGDRWMRQIQGGHLHSDALNEIAIGICFVGDFNSDRPTKKQIAAAIELITYLNQICGKPPVFKAHREINPRPTECPGKNFPVKAFHQLFDQKPE